jgi:dTDP-4-dehydrorhamnose 3,5-epimerase
LKETSIPGVILDGPTIHEDARGWFLEIARSRPYGTSFTQWNHSYSVPGVLRGLHYHVHQSDLWYVASGTAQVALVDLRERSNPPAVTTFVLESETPTTVFIPPGVAHGFLSLTSVDMLYAVTHEFDASDERGIAWNDPQLGIEWREGHPSLSDRDKTNPELRWEDIPRF